MSKVTHIRLPIAMAKDLLERLGGMPTFAGWGKYYDGLIEALAIAAQEHVQAQEKPKRTPKPVTKATPKSVTKAPAKTKAAPKEDKKLKITKSPEVASALAPVVVPPVTEPKSVDAKTKRRDYMRARRAAQKAKKV